jgi:hypothetical protein
MIFVESNVYIKKKRWIQGLDYNTKRVWDQSEDFFNKRIEIIKNKSLKIYILKLCFEFQVIRHVSSEFIFVWC